MRRTIDTVPKDGTELILHDEMTGRCELVRWSPDQNIWISPDGKSCDINASCWYPLRANHPPSMQAGDNTAEQGDDLLAATSEAARTVPSPPVQPATEHLSQECTPSNLSNRTDVSTEPGEQGRSTASGGRRKLALGIAMMVASLAGFYFRPQVVAWASRAAEQKTVMPASSPEPVTQANALAVPHIAHDSGPTEHRVDAPAPRPSDSREDFEKQTAQWRQELAESQRREELQKANAAELQRSLEEAQEKISRLENQLSLAQQIEKPAVSRKQTRRAERRSRNRGPRTFFGAFGSTRPP